MGRHHSDRLNYARWRASWGKAVGALPGLVLFAVAIAVLSSASAEAIPAFARRYDLPCHFCHDGFPKLSVLGEQFKARGYRLDDDVSEVSDWLRSVPVSFRGTFRQTFEEEGDAESLGLFKLVSAGNLGSRVSYWVDHTFVASSDSFERPGFDNLFLRVEIVPDEIYVRAGRIEMDIPFTQARSPQLFGYEIYFANTGFETDNIGTHQDGVEVGGFIDDDTRWSIALVNGQSSEQQQVLSSQVGGFNGNLFGRLQRRAGEGRAGAFFYWGRNTLATEVNGAAGPEVIDWDDGIFRIGGDGAVYLGQSQLYGTFLYGRNSNSFADADHPDGTGAPRSFSGGFAQLDYALRDDFFLTGRFELLHGPPPGTNEPSRTFFSFHPGLRLYLFPRLRLAFELGFRNQSRPTRGALHVELVL